MPIKYRKVSINACVCYASTDGLLTVLSRCIDTVLKIKFYYQSIDRKVEHIC